MAIGQNHQLTQPDSTPENAKFTRTEMLTAYNSINLPGLYLAINYGNADIVETIFNSLSSKGYEGYSRKNLMRILEQKIKMVFSGYF